MLVEIHQACSSGLDCYPWKRTTMASAYAKAGWLRVHPRAYGNGNGYSTTPKCRRLLGAPQRLRPDILLATSTTASAVLRIADKERIKDQRTVEALRRKGWIETGNQNLTEAGNIAAYVLSGLDTEAREFLGYMSVIATERIRNLARGQNRLPRPEDEALAAAFFIATSTDRVYLTERGVAAAHYLGFEDHPEWTVPTRYDAGLLNAEESRAWERYVESCEEAGS